MPDLNPAIKTSNLFLNLEEKVVNDILGQSEVNTYKTDDILIEKGSVPAALIIVSEGEVGIYNEHVLLARLGSLSILGESFLANASATATIVALTDLTVLEIKREIFYKLAILHPGLVFNIFTINHQRLRASNELALKEAHAREQKLEEQVNERTAELRATNAELEVTRDNLIETQKFRQQFLANMSHEIRTPMNAIVGLTNLLLKSPLNELQEKYLGVIKKSGANLLVIINDILDLAKIESGKMELEKVPFPFVAAIKNIQTILNLKAEEKGISMEEIISPDVPEFVFGDETRITQVIMNLAGNAIKFTEKGGVKISVGVDKVVGEVFSIRVGVRDSGIGIPEDKIDKIFESFGQASADTTRKFGGTGLGLTISKQLVEMHGGELKVSSVVGEGSEFYFTIDYKKSEKPVEEKLDNFEDIASLKGKKILLVEDNQFNQMVAVDTINDIFPDIQVDVAENGKIAIDMVQKDDYAFLFMDIQMPEMDGYEATRQIRSILSEPKRSIRICAMTANVTKEEIDKCMEVGMNDYMMKPFTHEILREKVIRNATGN